jgi:quercetin dioxygenase-like cupin family protein
MIHRYDSSKPVEMMPGLIRRMLAECSSMMICEFTLDKGVEIPVHSHPHEQVGYIASGRIKIIVDGESFELKPGDCYSARPGVPHGAVALERTVVVDTFNPPREDYR